MNTYESKSKLEADIRFVKGIGEKRAKLLGKLGIFRLSDLIGYFPWRYEDRQHFEKIENLKPGMEACMEAMVVTSCRTALIRKGMEVSRCLIADETGRIDVTFFNQKYAVQQLKVGQTFLFYGRVREGQRWLELVNPVFELPGIRREAGRIVPFYRLCAGVRQNLLRGCVQSALAAAMPPEVLPDWMRTQYELCYSDFAYQNIHFPETEESLQIARRRLIFQELLLLCLGLEQLKERKRESAEPMVSQPLELFQNQLPFPLTQAQERCIREIMQDLSSGECMNRLLQGDVGSGKTVVAAAAAWIAWKNGRQSALMAPTELLAQQHYATLCTLLVDSGMRVGLLTGGMTAGEKREVHRQLAQGEIDVCVGTHALLSESVEFSRLGLVIPDEQHRFGVRQRAALAAKGEQVHVLVMSATPIPRTLALILYGDLDVSIIDQMPPGRKQVETYAVGEEMRPRVQRFIRRLVQEGRQVYIVCPLVEESEDSDGDEKKAVEKYAGELRQSVFPDLRIGLVHGRMKPKEKETVMTAFASGQLDVLVATTVIEVGVDVPNAALMVVENAERFGLSQLHQLRGRVGRGAAQSYCILMNRGGGETARERLRVMTKTNSGFKIAEEDLKLRGPGDFFGSAQHGMPALQLANLTYDVKLLQQAQEAAQTQLKKDPALEQAPELRNLVRKLFSEKGDIFN